MICSCHCAGAFFPTAKNASVLPHSWARLAECNWQITHKIGRHIWLALHPSFASKGGPTFQDISTRLDGLVSCMQKPEQWLKKVAEVHKAALWLEDRQGSVAAHQPAVLRLPRVDTSALMPVFAVIEGGADGELPAAVNVTLAPLESVITDRQLEWLRAFAAALPLYRSGPCFALPPSWNVTAWCSVHCLAHGHMMRVSDSAGNDGEEEKVAEQPGSQIAQVIPGTPGSI